jgi:hypothetical protein
MNESLGFYKDEKKVWHISGWNYPIDTEGLDDVFLWRVMNCWGWATWTDRWQHYEKDVDKLINQFSKEDIKQFNLEGAENFWGQVIANKEGKINTWAIFWYATIFQHNGLCLNPIQTFVENIGHDGSGVHCGESGYCSGMILNNSNNIQYFTKIEENRDAIERIKKFYLSQKKPVWVRIVNKVARVTMGENIIK